MKQEEIALQRNNRYDKSKIHSEERKDHFVTTVFNRFHILSDLYDGLVEKKWENVGDSFREACEETKGVETKTYRSRLSEDSVD